MLVVTWRNTIEHPVIPGEFAWTSLFPRTIPWDSADVTITTSLGKPLQTETHGPAFEHFDEGGHHVYRWHYSAPAVPEDPAALSPEDRVPRLFASTFPSWADFSRSYAALVAPKTEVTPSVQALADEVTAGVSERREQAQRLYDWVSGHVRWVAIWLGNGGYMPHTAEEVLANGYGDCKDQVVLLMALLRAKGIPAEPVLVNLGPSYTLSKPATYTAFNHVITYLPEWRTYADTTSGSAPFGTLTLPEYGKPVLHLTASGEAPSALTALSPGLAHRTLGYRGQARGERDSDRHQHQRG